jgi:hypothetical protein
MRASLAILAASFLAVAPFAFAHGPAGTPKNFCEPPAEWSLHEYGPLATGRLVYGNEDGNMGGDCSGATVVDPGTPCAGFGDPADPLSVYAGSCGSEIDPPAADWDEHNEFAFGGAWILVSSGDGTRGGTIYCFGAEGHHEPHGPFAVDDLVWGVGASFTVTSTGNAPGDGCGDFQAAFSHTFQGDSCPCHVTFPPGPDGAYLVYVEGTQGHFVWW